MTTQADILTEARHLIGRRHKISRAEMAVLWRNRHKRSRAVSRPACGASPDSHCADRREESGIAGCRISSNLYAVSAQQGAHSRTCLCSSPLLWRKPRKSEIRRRPAKFPFDFYL